MKVAFTDARGETRLEDAPDPQCGPGDVVCRVLACAAGDADLDAALPAVLGREPSGEVVAVGAGVDAVADGDAVAIHTRELEPGGFAEYVRVPARGELLPLEGVDPVAATLLDPLAAALRAQDRAELTGEDALLVVGTGVRGLLHVAAAFARGVEDVLIRESHPDLRALAQRWGARPYGGERVTVAIVTTPAPRDLADAAETLAAGGRLLLHADPRPRSIILVDAHTLAERELRLTASHGAGPHHARAALTLLRAGAVPIADLITARFSLALAGDALAAQRSGAALKAVVLPWA
jgi:L-iditol 2-dehydrogenase